MLKRSHLNNPHSTGFWLQTPELALHTKRIVSRESTVEEIYLFECWHHRISPTDSKVATTLEEIYQHRNNPKSNTQISSFLSQNHNLFCLCKKNLCISYNYSWIYVSIWTPEVNWVYMTNYSKNKIHGEIKISF